MVELTCQTVRSEFAELLRTAQENDQNDLIPVPPPVRDIDIIITRMQATGKYHKQFLPSLRKGLQRSQTFKKPEKKVDA